MSNRVFHWIHLIWINHYHWIHLFSIKSLKLVSFRLNWNYFVMALSKRTSSLRKLRLNLWHKAGKHFKHFEIIWFRFNLNFFCCFLTFNQTRKKNRAIFQVSDTSDMIPFDLYISYDISERFIKFLMMTISIIMMMINQIDLIFKYTNLQLWMILFITFREQNLILKFHIIKPRSWKFQSMNKFLELFDLPDTDTPQASPTSFANQSSFSLLFNQSQNSNRSTRTKHDVWRLPRKFFVFSMHFPLRINIHFQESSIEQSCS